MKKLVAVVFAGVVASQLSTAHGQSSGAKTNVPKAAVTLKFLGTTGWEITDGSVVILVDPYLSRLRTARPGPLDATDRRPILGPDDVLVPDEHVIDSHITRADLIVVSHDHADHVLDVPYIARKTKAIVVGTESTTNLMHAYGIPDDQLVPVRGGEDFQFKGFSLRVIPSMHSKGPGKHNLDSRTIPATIAVPLRFRDYVEGGSLAFLIRLGGQQILTGGSGMGYVERELEGLRPDVAMVGAGPSRLEYYAYTSRLMRVLGNPPLVLAQHWDDYRVPFDAPQTEGRASIQDFLQEVREASPRTRVIVPNFFEPITLGGAKQTGSKPRRSI
jgi:L-ascorbate metabolism protein UlaG (beta-lactamase superfamily)